MPLTVHAGLAAPVTNERRTPRAMSYETIVWEVADGVATLTLNRPDVHNAMNERMRGELVACFGGLVANDDVRVVVVTGAGERAFSAGADIREFVAPQVP